MILSTLNRYEVAKVAGVLWAIWRSRNELFWHNLCTNPTCTVQYSLLFIHDFDFGFELYTQVAIFVSVKKSSHFCCYEVNVQKVVELIREGGIVKKNK